jgi:hypothetical protein
MKKTCLAIFILAILSSCGNLGKKEIVAYRLDEYNTNIQHYFLLKRYLHSIDSTFKNDSLKYKLTTHSKSKKVWMEVEVSFIDQDSIIHSTFIKTQTAYPVPENVQTAIKDLNIGSIYFDKHSFRISYLKDISKNYADYILLKRIGCKSFTEQDESYYSEYETDNKKTWLYPIDESWAIQGELYPL